MAVPRRKPVRMRGVTKALLERRVRELMRQLKKEIAFSNSLTDEVVAYTANAPIRVGETVMVRVPRRFMVR